MKKTVTMKRTTGKGKVANGDHPVSADGPTRGGSTQPWPWLDRADRGMMVCSGAPEQNPRSDYAGAGACCNAQKSLTSLATVSGSSSGTR